MSFKIGGIVIEDLNRGMSAYEKLILTCFASFAWKDGSSIFPAQDTIAEMAMCKPRMVRKALAKFETDQVLIFVGKKGRTKENTASISSAPSNFMAGKRKRHTVPVWTLKKRHRVPVA